MYLDLLLCNKPSVLVNCDNEFKSLGFSVFTYVG